MRIKLTSLIVIGLLFIISLSSHGILASEESSSDNKATLSFVLKEETLTTKSFSTAEKMVSLEEESYEQEFLIRIYEHENITPIIEENLDKNTDISLNPGLYKLEITSENETYFRGYNLSEGERVIVPLYQNTQQRDFVSDAPWRVEPNQKIPFLFEIKDVFLCDYDIGYIKIYLDTDKDEDNDESEDRLLKKIWYGITLTEGDWYDDYKLSLSGYDDNGNYYNLQGENYFHIVFEENDGWDDCFDTDQHFHTKVNTDNNYLKKIDKWYCGDTHYHSSYTDTSFEFGGPVDTTIDVLKSIGLNWVTITDHSNSFSNHKNDSLSWENFKTDCNNYNECLIGTEINCDYQFLGGGNHLLSYNYGNFIDDRFNGWVPLPGFDMVPGFDNPSCNEMINDVYNQGGFVYAAHPETISDPFGFIIDKWHNYSLPISGLEIWNENINHTTKSEGIINALEDGLIRWRNLTLNGRKIFISAGSDAHGDFQEFGREYTCCYASSYSKSNIFNALKNGNCFISNNGALKLEIDNLNGNKKILGDTIRVLNNGNARLDIGYFIQEACDLSVYEGIIGNNYETKISLGDIYSLSNPSTYTYDISNINSARYYRLECISEDGKSRIYTNPIWVNPINCFENSDCGVDSANKYCSGNNACESTITYTCHNPGTEQSYCTSASGGGCSPCAFGCNATNFTCNPPIFTINLTINSPKPNIFNDRSILLNLQTTQQVDEITYEDLTDRSPRERRLCSNCDYYNGQKSFSDGNHSLIFRAIKDDKIVDEENVSFFVDSKEPRISKTEPRKNAFTNGKGFYVKFKEENIKNVTITFNPTVALDLSTCTESRGYYECYIDLNLTNYDNQEIEYYFVVEDIAGNKDESKPILVKVDTTPPVLNNPESFWEQGEGRYQRYIYFDFDVTEKNFDEITYTYIDSRGRERESRLCSRLRDGKCEVRKSFSRGEYDLTISIRDEAGNSHVEEDIIFNVA